MFVASVDVHVDAMLVVRRRNDSRLTKTRLDRTFGLNRWKRHDYVPFFLYMLAEGAFSSSRGERE